MRGMRLPLTVSIAGHASVLALLVLLVANPSPPDPPVRGGIEVALGQTLSQPQAVLAPEPATRPADPTVIPPPPATAPSQTRPGGRGRRSRAAPYPSPGSAAARSNRVRAATTTKARHQTAAENGRAPAATASNCLCAEPGTEPVRPGAAGCFRSVAIPGGAIRRGRRDACKCPGTGSHRELSGNDCRLVRGPQTLSRFRPSARRGGKRRAALSG